VQDWAWRHEEDAGGGEIAPGGSAVAMVWRVQRWNRTDGDDTGGNGVGRGWWGCRKALPSLELGWWPRGVGDLAM
jgi:hypothetical protein